MGNLMSIINELTPQMEIESENSNRVPALLHDEANHLIVFGELLDRILLKLDSPNLLSSRRVNSNWNRIISKILLTRLDFSLTFKYSLLTPPGTFILQNNSFASDSHLISCRNLGSLTSLMTLSSSTFPCSSFRFNLDCGGHLTHHQISSFFLLHGSHVRTLSILFDGHVDQLGHTTPMSDLVDLLLNHVPLLKTLTLNLSLPRFVPINQLSLTKWPLIPMGSQMTNLEILRIGRNLYSLEPTPLLRSILSVSPNLKMTQISHLTIHRNLEALIDTTTKVHSIRFNSATIILENNFEILETFSRFQMKLRRLHFCGYSRIMQTPHLNAAKIIFKKILEGSKETLEIVSLNWITLTIMKSLSEISIHKVNEFVFNGTYEEFLRELWANNLPAIFPNLSHVTLVMRPDYPGQIQRDLGDGHATFHSVRSLHLWSTKPNKMPGNLYKIFPNIESLSDKLCLDFYLTAPNVWKFKRLKNLELNLYAYKSERNIFPRIDSAFTGFSEATVRRLRNKKIDDLESLRENSSILDLAELESLKIIFCSFNWPLTSSIGLYSDVMAKFALNQMPRLEKVKFCTKPPRASSGCPPLNIQSLELALKPLLKSIKNVIWEPNSHSPQHLNGPDEYF